MEIGLTTFYSCTLKVKIAINIHDDHIKPVSSFNLLTKDGELNEKEMRRCWHYTNHQPLFADENLSKSNKWTKEDEINWRENIIDKSLL